MLSRKIKILGNCFLLLVLFGQIMIPRDAASSKTLKLKFASNHFTAPFVIGGFTSERGGDGASIEQGLYFSGVRSSIAQYLPNASYVSFATLTAEAINGVDLLFLSSTFYNDKAITPLSQAEQTVLHDYVLNGGCAILLTDNELFGGTVESVSANNSLLDPFEITSTGYINSQTTAVVTNPLDSPITNGFYGIVYSFRQNFPGYITNDGSYATRLANNGSGGAFDVIYADAIQPGSGPVFIFSDGNLFFDQQYNGYYYQNENLLMNTIHYCYTRTTEEVLYTISGQVTDSQGHGIPYTTVTVIGIGSVVTNENGYYTISGVPPGDYVIELSKDDFEFTPATFEISVSGDVQEQNSTGTRVTFYTFLPAVLR